ncbi:MAG: hypothetical protein HQL97_01120 [Magnetococcales bacterium]|nr:hypothetical protein [Magnetococcales bacterium]
MSGQEVRQSDGLSAAEIEALIKMSKIINHESDRRARAVMMMQTIIEYLQIVAPSIADHWYRGLEER